METVECSMKGRHLPVCCETQPRGMRDVIDEAFTLRLHGLQVMSCTSACPQARLRLLKDCRNSIASSDYLSRLAAWSSREKSQTSPIIRIQRSAWAESPATSSTRQRALFVETLTHFGKTGLACLIDCVRHEFGVLRLIPTHDCVSEGFHGRFARFRQGARRPNFGFPRAAYRRPHDDSPSRNVTARRLGVMEEHLASGPSPSADARQCEVHRPCLSAQDVPYGRVSRHGSERRAGSRGCGWRFGASKPARRNRWLWRRRAVAARYLSATLNEREHLTFAEGGKVQPGHFFKSSLTELCLPICQRSFGRITS